ncbi:MAG: uracil-DNA glycosylase family protein [Halorientalis sp.]
MDANQERVSNPYGMDEDCQNCPALCETRTQVVHGYGDVAADFVFVGEAPNDGADRTGHPFTGDAAGERMQAILGTLGFSNSPPDSEQPDLDNVYLTNLTRCRDPDRRPSDDEVRNCEGFLTAEIRMINPEIIVPVGQRPLEALAVEYTTTSPEEFDIEADHATTIRGRGFELLPTVAPADLTDEQRATFEKAVSELLGRDYRQTKGRRSR